MRCWGLGPASNCTMLSQDPLVAVLLVCFSPVAACEVPAHLLVCRYLLNPECGLNFCWVGCSLWGEDQDQFVCVRSLALCPATHKGYKL